MTTPDMNAMAVAAARLVGLTQDTDGCWWFRHPVDRFVGSDLLDERAGGALLLAALLAWCHANGIDYELGNDTDPEMAAGFAHHARLRIGSVITQWPGGHGASDLDALLLALHAAGHLEATHQPDLQVPGEAP